MERTKNCCYCLKHPAKSWSGHVVRKGKGILAGWCGEKCRSKSNKAGFMGLYKKKMGREKDD